jgi:hypothetical protein
MCQRARDATSEPKESATTNGQICVILLVYAKNKTMIDDDDDDDDERGDV